MLRIALTIAGSDPSGGAGIQADLKTFHQHGVYGAAAITLLTVQNTRRVSRVQVLDPRLVTEQVDAVLEDLPPHAAKTGALGNAQVIEAVAALSLPCPLIVDPVIISKHGAALLDPAAVDALRNKLLPRAALVTPNLKEAESLAGIAVDTLPAMRDAARRIAGLGCPAVLVKGGHLEGDAVDILLYNGEFAEFRTRRIQTQHTHGTGCTYSAAIAANVALGLDLRAAVERAKRFIDEAIRTNPGIGGGSGPVNHWAKFPLTL